MPKINGTSIGSMLRQVEELVSLSREISSWLGKRVNVRELYRKYQTAVPIDEETGTEALKGYTGTAGEMYILLLELAYDRVYLVLRLIIDFVEYRDEFESCEEKDDETTPASLVRVESYAGVARAAKLLWTRLKDRSEFKENDSRERTIFVDEYKVGHRLATMNERKIYPEKRIAEIRKETIDRPAKEKDDEPNRPEEIFVECHASPTINSNGDSSNGMQPVSDEAEDLLVSPNDDPVADMTSEISSNERKIDRLLRQNERLSRALVRITRHNSNNDSGIIKSID